MSALAPEAAQDRMHYLMVLVIAVFMAMYLGLGFMRLS
jgi:hypothetical protein